MRVFAATLAASLMSASAFAADQVYMDTTPEVGPAAYDWSGLYIGAHVGYGFAGMNGVFDNGGAPGGPYDLSTIDPEGFLGGIHAGYNVQWNQFVFGVEGDVSGADIDVTAQGAAPPAGNTVNIEIETNVLASIRARAGLAMDNILFYGTVGAGYADYDFSSTFSPTIIGTGTVSDDDWGVVFGAGIEYARGNWLFRGEVLHYDITPSRTFTAGQIPDADAGDFVNYDGITTVRTGISYKF